MARSQSTIFDSEFVSGFDPKQALCGGLVDIRIAERWCVAQGIDVADLKRAMFLSRLYRFIKWGCIGFAFICLGVFSKLIIESGSPRELPTGCWILLGLMVVAFIPSMCLHESEHCSKFRRYVKRFRRLLGSDNEEKLDQDIVALRAQNDLECFAQAYKLAKLDLDFLFREYVDRVKDKPTSQPDWKETLKLCEKINTRHKAFKEAHETYECASKVESAAVYLDGT